MVKIEIRKRNHRLKFSAERAGSSLSATQQSGLLRMDARACRLKISSKQRITDTRDRTAPERVQANATLITKIYAQYEYERDNDRTALQPGLYAFPVM